MEEYSKNYLKKLYRELGSISKVAEEIGVPNTTVVYYFNKHRINIRKGKGFPIPKKDLIELHEKYRSITKVAAYLSKPYSTVRHWYHYHNIVVNKSGMTVFHEIRTTPMGDKQKSVLLGSLLGDGGFWLAPHCKNARLYVIHCEKQKPYLEWIHGLLQPFSRPIKHCEKAGKKIICDREVNASNFYRFWTIAHPDVTDFFKRYYREGRKCVTESIIDELDLLALGIWIGDDGSVQKDRYGIEIATCSFTYAEHLILAEALSKFFDGNIHIRKHSGKDREDFVIKMSGKKEIIKFLDMIKSVLPKCIYYKL